MVIDKNMDCARFPDGSSCQLRKQMQKFDAEMEKYFVQIDDVLKMTIDAGCMQPTKLTVDSSSESSSTSSQDTNKDTSSSQNTKILGIISTIVILLIMIIRLIKTIRVLLQRLTSMLKESKQVRTVSVL